MERYIHPFARWIVRHSLIALLVGAAVTIGAGAIASNIRFDTGFAALLPSDTPAVLEVERVKEKAGGTVDLIVVLESLGTIDPERRLRFARRLVERLEQEPWIRRADAEYPIDFFLDRRLLLLDIDELEALEEAVQDDINRAKATASNPLFVNLQDDEAPWSNTEGVLKKARSNVSGQGVLQRDLRSKDNRYAFVRVKPMGTSFDMAEGAATLAKVDTIVRSLDPESFNLGIKYSGAMPVNQDQHRTMTTDLSQASMLALVLVLLVLTLFTGQPGAPLVIAGPLAMGISATLAVTTLTIGQLNLVSGFLVTALVGVGVDYGIHLFLRYLEALKTYEDRSEAMVEAIRSTFPGCLTSGLTTFAAFLAMTFSDFRGFQEYGQIAATGVALTLLSTFFLMPPLAMMLTRRPGREAQRAAITGVFKRRYAWTVLTVGLAFTLYSIPASWQIRYHNEFKKELRGYSEASEFQSQVVEKSLGGSLNPAVVAVRNLEEARRVEAVVRADMAKKGSQFDRVLSLATLVPEDLDAREEVVERIREEIDDVPKERLKESDRKQLADYAKLTQVGPWQVKDIPEKIRRLFYAVDGSLMFVLIWPSGEMAEDAEIIAWARALDGLQANLAEAGIEVPVLDENRIAARVLAQIRRDGPWAVAYGFITVVLLLIVDFRSPRRVVLVTGTLVVGFVWMFGLMYAFGLNVNVFNMAVFPTVLGIGIDNAVHLMHRYDQEGPGSVLKVVMTTGAAAVLASLTTGIGFAATLIAHHNGIKSMGELAVVGFTGSLLASTILFPAVLRVLERTQADGRTLEMTS